ncbi:MAG: response regulator, partial [bacterium]|nr:response regulator [bacterium]
MRYDVLVVDDETSLLRLIVQGLEDIPSLRPAGASSLGEALAVLDSEPPDLLITDIRLDGESGLDLIRELDRRGLRIPVIVMTGHRDHFRDQLAQHPGLTVLDKPMPIAEMGRRVEDILASCWQRGEDPFALADYLQLAVLAGGSLRFTVELASGRQGRLEVVDGELWNAYADGLEGKDALTMLLGSESHSLDLSRMEEPPPDRQLAGSIVDLLLELAQADDETARDSEPTLATGEEPQKPASSPELKELFRRGSGSLALRLHLDDAANRACRSVQEDIETSSCALVDVAAATLVGVSPLTSHRPELLDAVDAGLLRLFRRALEQAEGKDAAPMGALDEVFLASREQFRFFKQVPGKPLVIALFTGKTTRQGIAWMALRRALPSFQEWVWEGEGPGTLGNRLAAPIRRQLDDSASRACQRVANNIAGARCCGLLNLGTSTLVGLSDLGTSDLLDDITSRAVDLFRTSTGAGVGPSEDPPEEVFASSVATFLFLKRVPAGECLMA